MVYPTILSEPKLQGLTAALDTAIEEMAATAAKLNVAAKMVEDAGERAVPTTVRLDARRHAKIQASIEQLKLLKYNIGDNDGLSETTLEAN